MKRLFPIPLYQNAAQIIYQRTRGSCSEHRTELMNCASCSVHLAHATHTAHTEHIAHSAHATLYALFTSDLSEVQCNALSLCRANCARLSTWHWINHHSICCPSIRHIECRFQGGTRIACRTLSATSPCKLSEISSSCMDILRFIFHFRVYESQYRALWSLANSSSDR